jgi:hypothetical protein
MELARWLVDSANPLTPRVIVNRHWQAFFGRGLVETDNDFGTQGTPPTHPELLDWLAVEFIHQGWSAKAMHRLIIVNSATYRQSSRHRADLAEVDPRNFLLARQNRLRLEAEIVRDAALAAAGLLARHVGGPSVTPPQPEGVYAFTQDPKPWKAALGSDRFRRGMYTQFWRSSPYPALTVFDAPDANLTCTRRVRSNTPLQALTLANDVVYIECAQALARRVTADAPGETLQQAAHLFRACLGREPTSAERDRLAALFENQKSVLAGDLPAARGLIGGETIGAAAPADAEVPALAAWTAAARVLLNVDEFITRE